MSDADCADRLREAFRRRGNLSEEDIQFIFDELRDRFAEASGQFNFRDQEWTTVAANLARDIREAAFVERRNRRLSVAANQKLDARAAEADQRFGDPSLAAEAATVGTVQPLTGSRISVEGAGKAYASRYIGSVIAELESEGLLTHFNTSYLDHEIVRAIEKVTKPEAQGSTNPIATRIAEIVVAHRQQMVEEMNRWGSWIKDLKGFIVSQNWDIAKVRKLPFEEFRDFILPLLDQERTFKGRPAGPFLREVYRTLANGEQLSASGSENDLNLAFKGPGNLGKRLSVHRVLHFRDADAWWAANEKLGKRTFREALLSEFERNARNIAIMQTFGPNPRATWEGWLERMRRKYSDDPTKVDRLRRQSLQWFFDGVAGDSRRPYNTTLAAIDQGARAAMSVAHLGGAVLSSITDLASKAAQIRYLEGGGLADPIIKAVTTWFDGMGKEAKELGYLAGLGLDGQSDEIARFAGTEATTGTGSRMLRIFFKANLLTPWTDSNKRGIGLYAAGLLAHYERLRFGELPDNIKFILGQYDIDARKWEVARQAVRDTARGRLLMPDGLRDLPSETFMRHGLDPAIDREGLETALRSYLIDVQDFGVPTPGVRERALLTWGFRPGTPAGTILNWIAQFKTFPLTVLTKVWSRALWGNADGRKDLVGLAAFLASATVLGYASMSLKSLLKGLTPPDPKKPQSWIAAFTQGGGAGIYGDFFLGQTNRFGRSLLDTMAGPTLGTISDIDELRARLMAGDDATATALRLAINHAPFVNLFYTRLALDYLILYQLQEAANPGYLRRREQQLAKDQGQKYLLPAPSTVIPYGGQLLSQPFAGVR